MLELLSAWLAGLAAGATGLAPFAHTNLALELFKGSTGQAGAVFSAALAFSHAAFEALPAVFFGIPALDYAAGVLPAHALALQGKGREALELTLNTLLASGLASLLLLPLALTLVPALYEVVKPITPFLLLAIMLALAATERSWLLKAAALLVFALSGALGVLALSSPFVPGEPLFALLTGLFGFPALLAARGTISVECRKEKPENTKPAWRWVVAGSIAGALSGVVPAVSGAMLSAVLFIALEEDRRSFLTVSAALVGSRLFYDAVATQTIGKARSGAAAAVLESLGFADAAGLALSLAGGLLALLLACEATRKLAPLLAAWMAKPQVRPNATLLVFLLALGAVYFQSGWPGMLVAATGAAVGALPLFLGVKRSHAMGCLLLPSILHGLLGPWELEALVLCC